MFELVKIGLLDSGQEVLTSTTKTGPGDLLRLRTKNWRRFLKKNQGN
jgi:hypothetical protein